MNMNELRSFLMPPCPALDVHVHPVSNFGPYPVASAAEDARRLAETGRRAGVAQMCLFSLDPSAPLEPTMEQCRSANDYVLAMRDTVPDVFLPFAYLNPMYPQESAAELERCVSGNGMRGVKLWVARRATDPGLDPILETAARLGVPVLQHAWDKTTGNLPGESFPWDVADLARRHPTVPIIMAHLNGVGLRGIEAVAGCPNVYVETGGGDAESGMVERAVAVLGAARVLYGSDAPIRHFGAMIGKTLGAALEDTDKQAILWGNASRLLRV